MGTTTGLKSTSFVPDGIGGYRQVGSLSDPFDVAATVADLLTPVSDPSGGRMTSGLFDAEGNYIAPKDYPGGQDAYNAMIAANEGPTSEELRDLFSENLTAGDIYGDPLAGYEGVRDPVAGAVSAAMQNDYLNSILETDPALDTPSTLETLSQAQQDAKTEDMLDSILSNQAEDGTGFTNESARIAAEGVLIGKIAQAGVTDPAAQEAALNSAMGSLEEGGSGLDAVKAAAAGAQDFVEGLLKAAKDAVDAGYDKIADILPDGAMPDTVGVDPTTGQTTVVYGKTSGTPVLGGTVGTRGGGTYAGVTTTGSAIFDKLIKVIKEGGDIGSIVEATTGLPSDIVDPAVKGAKKVAEKAAEVLTLDNEDDPSKVVLTTTGKEALDPNSTNQVLTVGDDTKEVAGNGVEIVTGNEALDPNSTNQVLTVGGGADAVDTLLGGDEWQNDGASTVEEVISGRIIGDGLDAGTGPDEVVDPEPPELPPLPPELPEPPPELPPLPPELPPLPPEPLPEVPEPLPEVPDPLPEVPEPPPEVPEVPDFGGQGFMGVQTKPGDLVDLGPLYDISASSIFQEPRGEDEQDTLSYLYPNLGGSDIVQDYDIEELIRFLENQRG